VKYAAGSGDFNPLHHDYQFPQSKQLGSIIVHGRFKYAALGELVSNWLGHAGRIKKISCQYRGMDFPDRELVCRGTVTRKWEENGERLVALELWTENDEGKKTTPARRSSRSEPDGASRLLKKGQLLGATERARSAAVGGANRATPHKRAREQRRRCPFSATCYKPSCWATSSRLHVASPNATSPDIARL